MLVFNFYTLCSQTIGHEELILICTSQNESWDRKCDLDLQGKGLQYQKLLFVGR